MKLYILSDLDARFVINRVIDGTAMAMLHLIKFQIQLCLDVNLYCLF